MPKSKLYPQPSGPMTEIYLAANDQYKKGEQVPVTINGYRFFATVGHRNTLPAEVVKVLQDTKSSTRVQDPEKSDPRLGRTPRSQEEFFNPPTKHVYQADFDIEILKIHDK